MILSRYRHKSRFASQQLQCRKHLDTLSHRHIHIRITMQEQQRRMYLVRIEQRTLFYKKIRIAPRITVRHGNFTIRISPISFPPVTGMVTDAGMRDGRCKNIDPRLQVLCHEAAIGRTYTAYFPVIDKSMLFTKQLGTFYDILCHPFPSCIDVAGGEFLSETGGTARFYHIHHIAQCRVCMMRIAAFEITADRTASTIIIHYHRIFPVGVKMRRQVITAINGVTTRIGKTPSLAFAQLHIFQEVLT